jgi:thioredoxin reductase
MVEQLKENKAEILNDKVSRITKEKDEFIIKTNGGEKFSAAAVIVSSGADPRPLEVPGEKEYIGRGISYCTTCDAPLFANKDVAVVGGGNSGFEAALSMQKYANKIYILEASDKPKAEEINQIMAAKEKKIQVIASAAVQKIEGDKFVKSLTYQDLKTKEIKTLLVEGIFIEIGNIPATGFLNSLVDFNEKDEIIVDPKTCQTKTPGLYAAGDVTDVKYKQIVVACGEGTKALLSVAEYLRNKNNAD